MGRAGRVKHLVLLAAIALASCDRTPTRDWQGWVYPSAFDLTDDIPLGAFANKEACRASARGLLIRLNERRDENGDTMTGDYECGYKCKPDVGGLNLCERTEK